MKNNILRALKCESVCAGCIFSCVFEPCKLFLYKDRVCKVGEDRSLTCKNMGLEFYINAEKENVKSFLAFKISY